MAPRTTIYLPDELAERVKATEGLNVSAVCQEALTKEVERMETMTKLREGMTRIELAVGRGRKVAFVGRWLVEPSGDQSEGDFEDRGFVWDASEWGVAHTRKGRIAVFHYDARKDEYHFETYDDLDEAEESIPQSLMAEALAALGETKVVELDI
jgi:hypothetical protein